MKLEKNLTTITLENSDETSAILDALMNGLDIYDDDSEEILILEEFLDLLCIVLDRNYIEETVGKKYVDDIKKLEEKLRSIEQEYSDHEELQEFKHEV